MVDESYPLVLVTWEDAWFDFDARDVEEFHEDYFVQTVGFLVDDREKVLSLAQELLPNDDGFRSVTHIPKAIIKDVIRLGDGLDGALEEGYTFVFP